MCIRDSLKVLEAAGLISRGRDAQYRPCRLEAEPLDSAMGWIDEHRQVWADRFDRLGEHIESIQRENRRREIQDKQTLNPHTHNKTKITTRKQEKPS